MGVIESSNTVNAKQNPVFSPLSAIDTTVNNTQRHTNTLLSLFSQFPQELSKIIETVNAYSREESLLPSNVIHTPFHNIDRLINSTNPYHAFLESQKARKIFFETALVQVHTMQALTPSMLLPIQASLLQRTENYIRANLAFTFTFHRPEWNIDIEHNTIASLNFCNIEKFEASNTNSNGRNIFLISPMSGHFSTLLRKTIKELHADGYSVYITDWKSPFHVTTDLGEVTMEKYTEEILHTFQEVAQDSRDNVFESLAVCQPCPETMTAVAYAEKHNLPRPRTLWLMAGPVDVEQNPTQVNEVGKKLSPKAMESMRYTIPKGYAGAGRSVYPAPLQISLFMMWKPQEHMKKFMNLAFKATPFDEQDEKTLAFYTEYFAGMDLYHELYTETVTNVFQDNLWGRNNVSFKGEKIDFSQVQTPIITFEWREDDVCWVWQTKWANKLMKSAKINEYHLIHGDENKNERVGHYWVFSGRFFKQQVVPALQKFYKKVDAQKEK